VNRDGSGFRILVNVAAIGTPRGRLVLGDDGAFYSTTILGGTNSAGLGTIFRVNPDGTGFRVVRQFLGTNFSDGAEAYAGLTRGSDGTLYGVTAGGGLPGSSGTSSRGLGTIFKIYGDGGGYSILHRFEGVNSRDGAAPRGHLIEASDGMLYGMTSNGGDPERLEPDPFLGPAIGPGTIFRLNKDGSGYQVVYRFNTNNNGLGVPYGHLSEGTNGMLYGAVFSAIFSVQKSGSDFRVLHEFVSGAASTDGFEARRNSPMIATDQMIYGTTWFGGGSNANGVVYQMNQDGSNYQILARFQVPGRIQQVPRSPIVLGTDARLYCTTEDTGSTNVGSLFRTEEDGSDFRLLHQFGIVTNDGRIPNAMLEVSDSLLYGTTQSGGTNNGGTIFRVDKDGTNYVVLRRFTQADGLSPRGGLIEGRDGWLYGTANAGGSMMRGTVFKLSKDGSGFFVLWNFLGGMADGGAPQGELVQGTNGVLYGTTRLFGSASRGTIFVFTPTGPATPSCTISPAATTDRIRWPACSWPATACFTGRPPVATPAAARSSR
jgi:uncharacterized repeat protein (TIGR03803 family)